MSKEYFKVIKILEEKLKLNKDKYNDLYVLPIEGKPKVFAIDLLGKDGDEKHRHWRSFTYYSRKKYEKEMKETVIKSIKRIINNY